YLNLGFERGKYYVMSDKQNPRLQEFFDPFSPKILAMRQPFRDNATEARLLSVSPHETTNPNIPIILPEEYYVRMQQLRNSLALFTLHHFNEVQGNHMVSFDSLDVEPRLRQLAMPLSIVCQLWPEGARLFREYLSRRQDEVRKVRSLSWEGSLVNLICGIAAGDTELDPEFAGYYDSITGQIQAVTPTMVARMVKSSPKMVTQTLASVGFEVEWRWIDVDRGGQKAKKRTRAYCIPDARTWAEVISRYYHAENAETPWEAPDVLKSHRFVRVPGAVLSVPCVTSSPGNSGHKTVGTLGTRYSTRQEDDDDEPDYPCSVCGAESWRHGNDGWMCTGCRASPEGEVLSSANLSGGDPL
ncbi:MAG: hypothetical protein HYX87_00315, partial [Chloroflexi bacterium]|nr:hypothetical protein [Chloroflexota bacterium]